MPDHYLKDVYSFNKEQSKGLHHNNIVTVLMRSQNFDVQAALDYAGLYFDVLMQRFLYDRKKLPSWGPEIDANVHRFIDGMGQWVVGSLEVSISAFSCWPLSLRSLQWSFESHRYFDADHDLVRKTLQVELL